MLVTPRFVFLHLHKSGGSFVNALIRRHLSEVREIGYHLPATLIPPAFARLPVLGLVRSPWSYYVSWYSYQRQRPQPNTLFQVLSDQGRLDFAATIRRMISLGDDTELLDTLIARLPPSYGGRGLNLPGFALAPIRGTLQGFYSFLFDYLYGAAVDRLHVAKMEDLPFAMLGLMEKAGQPIGEELRRDILAAPPVNVSQHDHYASYYDPDLRDRVAVADAAVIARFGYAFGN